MLCPRLAFAICCFMKTGSIAAWFPKQWIRWNHPELFAQHATNWNQKLLKHTPELVEELVMAGRACGSANLNRSQNGIDHET